MKMGIGGAPLVKSDLTKAQLTPVVSTINVVAAAAPSAEKPCEFPQEVLPSLDTDQRAAFVRMWRRVPPHLHTSNVDFEAYSRRY